MTSKNKAKLLDAIIKKQVNLCLLTSVIKRAESVGKTFDYDWYKLKYLYYHYGDGYKILTEEEFNLLKEVLNNGSY